MPNFNCVEIFRICLKLGPNSKCFQNFSEDPRCSQPYFSKPYRWCIERKKIVQNQKPLKSTLISCFPRFFLLEKSFLPKNQPRHSKKEGVDSVFSRALLDFPTSDLRSKNLGIDAGSCQNTAKPVESMKVPNGRPSQKPDPQCLLGGSSQLIAVVNNHGDRSCP